MLPFRALFLLLLLLCGTAPASAIEPETTILAGHVRAQVEQLYQAALRNPDNSELQEAADDTLRFYLQRDFVAAWSSPTRLENLITAISELADDGLKPDDYALERLKKLHASADLSLTTLACRDVLATHAYLTALADLSLGRITPPASEVITHIGTTNDAPDRDQLTNAALAGLNDPVSAFKHARPDSARYQALQQGYAQLRSHITLQQWHSVPAGPSLHPEKRDVRVPLLRERLTAAGYVNEVVTPALPDTNYYDATLVAALQQFQHAHHLTPDGIVGPATLAALNLSPTQRLNQLRVNLERTRWLAHEVEPQLLLVDVAGAMVTYYKDAQPVWSARTQVGRSARPTPLLKSVITHFTFNPTWTVPPTILRKDKLPAIRRDIGYLEKNRIRVLDRNGYELDPESVDWDRPGAIMLRQDAGPGNALGRVVIRFPNPYWVYLHDTPSQRLFSRDQRNFSSGCVRVERATELVDQLLADGSSLTPQAIIRIRNSGRTREVSLDRPIPILIAYWTVDTTTEGTLDFRPDIYRRDAAVLQALSDKHAIHEIIQACH